MDSRASEQSSPAVVVRHFDRSKDSIEELSRLNPFSEEHRKWLAEKYKFPFPENNLIVAEYEGKLVGCLHIFDGGFPMVLLDSWWLEPQFRSIRNAVAMGRFAEDELRRRGCPLYTVYADEKLSKGLVWSGMTQRTDKPTFHILSRYLED